MRGRYGGWVAAALVGALLVGACSGRNDDEQSDAAGQPARIDADEEAPTRLDADRATAAGSTAEREEAADEAAVEPRAAGPTEGFTLAPPPDRGRSYEPELPVDTVFEDYGTNRFVETDQDPESTFAMDVDTGSYTLARGWLEEGLLPRPDAVRVEEFVNFFHQDYEAPRETTFAVYADGAPNRFGGADTHLLRVGIAAREVPSVDRSPAALTFVIDVSGSMGTDDRLGLVQDSLATLVAELDSDDTVAVVAYDDRAWEVLPPTPVSERREIVRAIDRLQPGGSTNAEAGLTLGYDLADAHFARDRINRVVLASDGVANVGTTDPDGILARIGDRARLGIQLVTVGVGIDNYNDVLLEQLADQGDGFYAYVDSRAEAERLFAEDLVGTLQTVALDAKVQVEFDDRAVDAWRLIGFENRAVADDDFRDDRVDAGEIGAGHTVTALYELELASETVGSSDVLGEVRVRWEDPDSGRVEEISGTVDATMLSDDFSDASARFQMTSVAATFAEMLRGSRYVDGGLGYIDLAVEAEAVARDLDDDRVWELVELIDRADRLSSR